MLATTKMYMSDQEGESSLYRYYLVEMCENFK